MKFSIKILFLKFNHFLLDAGMLSSFCKSSTSKYHLKAVFTPNDHIKEKKLPYQVWLTSQLYWDALESWETIEGNHILMSIPLCTFLLATLKRIKTCNWLRLEINHIWYHKLSVNIQRNQIISRYFFFISTCHLLKNNLQE